MASSEYRYAPASDPVPADAIHTASSGLSTCHVTIPTGDGEIPAYVARPAGVVGAPLAIVISEAFGLHEPVADVARRLAHEGFFALAPDLMVRQGDPSSFADVLTLVSDLLLEIPDAQVLADLDASIAWAALEGADPGRVCVTGFCWGGRWTWLLAAHRRMNAAVAWYGMVDGTSNATFTPGDPKFPAHPVDLVDELQTPVLGLYGGVDEAIPRPSIAAMERRLAAGGPVARESQIVVYEHAGHAFFADYRASYDPTAAGDAWERCVRWLKDRV